MSTRSLWFVRQGEKISGPYPEQLIARYVLLGRFKRHDKVSVDQAQWVALEDVAELLPAEEAAPPAEKDPDKRKWREERRQASLRWMDERRIPDRRKGKKDGAAPSNKRQLKDRREVAESPEVLAMRQRHAENELLLKKKREQFFTTAAVLIIMAFGLLVLVSLVSPVFPVKVGLLSSATDCMHPAGQLVNWAGCDKNGVNLAGADLKNANLVTARMQGARLQGAHLDYAVLAGIDLTLADLNRATLAGANLTGANLTSASLANADLRFADLRGASLEGASLTGALLGNAVWTDGRVCNPASVGQCR